MKRSPATIKIFTQHCRPKTGTRTEMSNGIRQILVGQASGMIDRISRHGTLGIGTERRKISSRRTGMIAMIAEMGVAISMMSTSNDKDHIGRQVIRNTKALRGKEVAQNRRDTTRRRQRNTRRRQEHPIGIAKILPPVLAGIMGRVRDEINTRNQLDLPNQYAKHGALPAFLQKIVEERDPVRYHLLIANGHVQGAGEDIRDQPALPPVDIANADVADHQGPRPRIRVGGKGESANMTPPQTLAEAHHPNGLHAPKNGIEKRRASHDNNKVAFGSPTTAMTARGTEDFLRQDPRRSKSLCRSLRQDRPLPDPLRCEIDLNRPRCRMEMVITTQLRVCNNSLITTLRPVLA